MSKTKGGIFIREEILDSSHELIDEDVLDEKFEEAVEEVWKIISALFPITAIFKLIL